jgi:hypothetical protein
VSRILLISTYELGGQPLGLSGAARDLLEAGHAIRAVDLAVDPWPEDALAWADGIATSVPMHTALRLGLAAVERARTERPDLAVAYFGLYAPVAAEFDVLGPNDATLGDDVAAGLVAFADRLGPRGPVPVAPSPRALLPPLDAYARFRDQAGERLVGPVEASVGCNHRCRHCPVPLVFDGRSRAIEMTTILDGVDDLVGLGAGHIHFADPDFLNRPPHALRVVRAIHQRHPDLTLDATIKVTHLLRHRDLLPELAQCGLRFVISAFESVSDTVLDRLDKGHSAADLPTAVALLRNAGIEPRPSLLPFTPWTTRDDLVALVDFVAAADLVPNVDVVQYGIRLLLPPGSLLLGRGDDVLDRSLGEFDESDLGMTWTASDPVLDDLQHALAALAEEAAEAEASPEDAYGAVRATIFDAFGATDPGPPSAHPECVGPKGVRPHLTESWFCCAEPTASQLGRMFDPRDDDVDLTVGVPVPVTLRATRSRA